MKYELVPVDKTSARRFIHEHYRHNEAPSPMQVAFAVGLELDGELVGVLSAGRPVARLLDDGKTLEVNRTCVRDYHRNANSHLYGAMARAAKALGYHRIITYTLTSESGSSLKACGFVPTPVKPNTWNRPNSHRIRHETVTLWGEGRNAAALPKFRWELILTTSHIREADNAVA